MAEAFARRIGEGQIEAESAGSQPSEELNPTVRKAMREIGYDMEGHRPKILSPAMAESADVVITMGCGADSDTCPAVFVPSEDWGLDDPHEQPVEKVREIRDEIERRVRDLISRPDNQEVDT